MAKERFKVGDYVIIKKSTVNWASDMDQYVGKRAQLIRTIRTDSDWIIDLDNGRWEWVFEHGHFVKDTSESPIVESGPKLNHFPQEGCVYESPENMKDFVKYLLNRPGNRADGKIDKSDAIGIAWNHSSCWWLKTKTSTKTVYSLSDLNNFLSIPNSTPIHKLPEKWYVKATKENEEILKKWRDGEHTGWSIDLVMKSSKYWDNETNTIKQGFLEISYDDFLRYVYYPEQNTGYIEFSYKKETEKYPQEDNKIVIPSISPVKINIDYSIKTISKISLPDFTVEPIKVESIIVKPFKLNY